MLNRPGRISPAILVPLVMVSSAALTGCGEERLSDDAYGFIDLAPFFYDGASPSNPTSALPRDIRPHMGWMNDARAEYYDFGLVGTVRKRTSTSTPDYAVVHPMYFFFDSQRRPLFSRPIYEKRTGLWHMRGGKKVLDPNPADAKDRQGNYVDRNQVYSIRTRRELVDPLRKISDYQRPIIDRLHNNSDYSGLWEIWEVTAPDGYEPDAIKSWETLEKGVSAGEFGLRRTQKVINCPVLDDRMYVQPTAMWYGIPRPRIEIWYRTKQGSCFLANGWETLGDANGVPYRANSDSSRVDTFDVIRFSIGEGTGKRTTVIAPVGKLWQPRVRVEGQDPSRSAVDIRYVGDFLSDATPRRTHGDPPGYRPIRWMWDIVVPQDPPYEPGTFKRADVIDPAQLTARSGPFTRNFPLIGVAVSCNSDKECEGLAAAPGIPLECNKSPSIEIAVGEPQPGKTVESLMRDREGGPRCDVPAVRFGEFCSPGIGRCALDVKGLPDEKPQFMGRPLAGVLPGYSCHPNPTGYCYFRCDGDQSNASSSMRAMEVDITYEGPDGRKRTDKARLSFDSRCGNIPGYACLTPSGTPAPPTKMRVCMRTCSSSNPEKFNQILCQLDVNVGVNEKVTEDDNIQRGMTCSNRGLSGSTGCQWDPAYEPRDPKLNFVPQ